MTYHQLIGFRVVMTDLKIKLAEHEEWWAVNVINAQREMYHDKY